MMLRRLENTLVNFRILSRSITSIIESKVDTESTLYQVRMLYLIFLVTIKIRRRVTVRILLMKQSGPINKKKISFFKLVVFMENERSF